MVKSQKNYKSNSGITLIALVITIIVLLILVGVSLNLVMGNEGILNRAENAEKKHNAGSEKEQIALAYNSALIERKGQEINIADLNIELNGIATVEAGTEDHEIKITFTTTKNSYILNKTTGMMELVTD